MKKLIMAIVVLLVSTPLMNAQLQAEPVLSEGSITALQILPNPENGTDSYDFQLCCGIPAGSGGFLANGFSYYNGTFTLFFHFPGFTTGFAFVGQTVAPMVITPINANCTSNSLAMVGTSLMKNVPLNGKAGSPIVVFSDGTAEYTQQFCQRDGVYWSSGGALTVHAPN